MTDLPEKEHLSVPEAVPESEGLAKEVSQAGVTIRPTTIPIPKPVQQMGVAPGPANIPMPAATTVPLTDDQIAQGLTKTVRDSWLWLSQWCIRQLKKVHMSVKYVHGKIVRIYAR